MGEEQIYIHSPRQRSVLELPHRLVEEGCNSAASATAMAKGSALVRASTESDVRLLAEMTDFLEFLDALPIDEAFAVLEMKRVVEAAGCKFAIAYPSLQFVDRESSL